MIGSDIPWLDAMKAALATEFDAKPYICTLATVDEQGHPRARSVVCRAIGPDGSLALVSDARSGKNAHVRRNPHVELVFWLPVLREQYRIAGHATVLTASDARAEELWKALPDPSRALFFWPEPGQPRQAGDAFVEVVSADATPPESFSVIVVVPSLVEHLDLTCHPHARRRMRRERGWSCEELNP